jgi:hypothetical protein
MKNDFLRGHLYLCYNGEILYSFCQVNISHFKHQLSSEKGTFLKGSLVPVQCLPDSHFPLKRAETGYSGYGAVFCSH